ncbi:MAG: dipeptidase [Caldilineales bacterium]|nr:dipeptidase [Caldilineales bacterium]
MHPLHQSSFVFDAHCDTIGDALLPYESYRDLATRSDRGHLDLPRWGEAGINCQIFACYPGYFRLNASPSSASLARLEAFHELRARIPDQITLIRTADDLRDLSADGPLGAILSLEGCEALEGSLNRLRTFFALGVRSLGMAWNLRNEACDGSELPTNYGLTPFGRDVVALCQELGIMIDVSHLNNAGLDEVLAMTDGPIIASHSNAHALCPIYRNLTDEQIRAIAATGGVIGATFVSMYLTPNPADATIEHLFDHIDHLVQVGGIDHIGIGSDLDGCTLPAGIKDGASYPLLTDGLLARGYAEQDIRKILGENFRRVFLQTLPAQ